MHDFVEQVQDTVRKAAASKSSLRIMAGGTKAFLGKQSAGTPLDISGYAGIVEYEPSELVVTVKAGTTLTDLEAILAEQGQMLAFEPPHYGADATIGGTVACGLSGPRRPYVGAVRDFVLGVRCINGKGEDLSFGGQVMKNVAGYDASRLMCGAFGALGVLLEVSLKVLPVPQVEITVKTTLDAAAAITRMNEHAAKPLPLSAACWIEGEMYLRLSGTEAGVETARERLGYQVEMGDADLLWSVLNEHEHVFFSGDQTLWRLSVPPTTPPLDISGACLIDWGGAQRWLRSDESAEVIRTRVEAVGGHATRYRGGDPAATVFHPLPGPMLALHQRLKRAFDPAGILNPGRMYAEI